MTKFTMSWLNHKTIVSPNTSRGYDLYEIHPEYIIMVDPCRENKIIDGWCGFLNPSDDVTNMEHVLEYEKQFTKEFYGAAEVYITNKAIYTAYNFVDDRYVVIRETDGAVLVWFYWCKSDPKELVDMIKFYVDKLECMGATEFNRMYNQL